MHSILSIYFASMSQITKTVTRPCQDNGSVLTAGVFHACSRFYSILSKLSFHWLACLSGPNRLQSHYTCSGTCFNVLNLSAFILLDGLASLEFCPLTFSFWLSALFSKILFNLLKFCFEFPT